MFRLYLTPYEEELCIKIKESVQILRRNIWISFTKYTFLVKIVICQSLK